MSIPDIINKKAFIFLKNVAELNRPFSIEDLQRPIESLIKPFIDKSSEKVSLIFQEFLKDKEQQKVFLEKNTSTAQQWRLIFTLYPNFCQYSLEDIFYAAIQASPNSSAEDSQQIVTCLKENQGVGLNQIYAERYTAQFLAWIQGEVYTLPSNSILLLLKIWQNFGNQSIDETWKELLSLSNWNSSHKQALDLFKSKHDFVIKNYLALQHIKFKERASVAEVPESIKSISKLSINQYVLWTKALDYLLREIAEAYEFGVLGFNKDSWEYQLLYTPKEISPKILIWRAKKITSSYQSKLQGIIAFFDRKIEDLKEVQEKINQLEYLLEQIKQGYSVYSHPKAVGIEVVSEEQQKQCEKNQPISKEQIEDWLKDWKETEESLQSDLKNPVKFRQDISHIEFLIKELIKSFIEPKKEIITEEQIACAEKNQRELIQAEDEFISSQKKSLKNPSIELVDTDVIEILSSSDDESNENVAVPTPALPSFVEIDAFLKDKGQFNGALSKSINGFLKQLEEQLLKMQGVPDELKALRKEKIHEIPTQLAIATAALELMIQAIEDQRFDHVVLGFRSGLIHCHFAIEQMLSLKILLESHESTSTHDLIELAKKAKIARFEEQREFLKDIGIHLWFCYPKDYPFFHPEKSTQPKTFLFLQRLFHPYEDALKKKLDVAMLKEAVQLFFSMYGQTMEFIIKTASVPKKNPDKLLHKIKEIQNQIQIKKKPTKFFLENRVSILNKCAQALDILYEIDRLENIKNFEKRLLLPLNTMKEYLELMKRSLEIPEKSHAHCLQEFIQVETLANMDKLFKDLFRTIILLQTGDNNYTHNLSTLFQLVKGFYEKDRITGIEELLLQEINVSITHHYLHKRSYNSLKKDYKYIFDLAEKLNLLSERDCIRINKRRSISYEILRRKKGEIFRKLDSAFDLFIKLLKPVIGEIKQLNDFSLNRL